VAEEEPKDPGTIAASIRWSIEWADGIGRIRFSQLRGLFGFRRWSPPRKDLVAKHLAVQGLEVVPPLSQVGCDRWITLSLPGLAKRRLERQLREELVRASNLDMDWLSRHVHQLVIQDVELIVLASTLGPLVTAFCTELGKRLGGTVADWMSRVKARPRESNRKHAADIVVEADDAVTSLEITDDLSDEAKLALLDLDISDQSIQGRRLRWDGHARRWAPASE
jgi:hypothetical protein